MGSTHNYIPVRTTRRYREAQTDEKFQGWLKMQSAAMEIVFPIQDVPELRDQMFTPDSLALVESKLLETFSSEEEAFTGDVSLTMRYVYYVGETFRRHLEGEWCSILKKKPDGATVPGIDGPYSEGFINPADLIGIALVRRTGNEISDVFGFQRRRYDQWVSDGRPERTFRGTLREDS